MGLVSLKDYQYIELTYFKHKSNDLHVMAICNGVNSEEQPLKLYVKHVNTKQQTMM